MDSIWMIKYISNLKLFNFCFFKSVTTYLDTEYLLHKSLHNKVFDTPVFDRQMSQTAQPYTIYINTLKIHIILM